MTKDEIAKGLSNSMLMRQLTFDIEDIYNSVMYVRSPLLLEVEDLEERLYAHRAIKSGMQYRWTKIRCLLLFRQ